VILATDRRNFNFLHTTQSKVVAKRAGNISIGRTKAHSSATSPEALENAAADRLATRWRSGSYGCILRSGEGPRPSPTWSGLVRRVLAEAPLGPFEIVVPRDSYVPHLSIESGRLYLLARAEAVSLLPHSVTGFAIWHIGALDF